MHLYFFRNDISNLVVRAGLWDLQIENETFTHQDRYVKKIVIHPDYNAKGLYNNLALIFTEDHFTLQENIKFMCLPTSNYTFNNTLCFTSKIKTYYILLSR